MSFFPSSNPRKHVVVEDTESNGNQSGAKWVALSLSSASVREVRNAGFPSTGLVLPSTPMSEASCQPTE
jgi:hypothetical protein